jgi:hypothetical protein
MGEGVAGVCGEGWEGRSLLRCGERDVGTYYKTSLDREPGPAGRGRHSPEGDLVADGAPCSGEGPER